MIQAASPPSAIVAADTVWILVSTALVLLMTPAAAFFYGGLVRAKNALNTMMMCFGAFGVVGVTWAVAGYSLAFSGTGRWIGDTGYFFLNGVGLEARGSIPHLLGLQALGVVVAIVYSGAMSLVLLKLVGLVIPLRVVDRAQGVGLDITQHGEEAYTHGEGALLLLDRRTDFEKRAAFAATRERT